MTNKITDLDFSRAAGMAERIAAAGNGAYWCGNNEAVRDLHREAILRHMHELAALHGLVLVPADTHAADAALAGIKSVQP